MQRQCQTRYTLETFSWSLRATFPGWQKWQGVAGKFVVLFN